MVWNLCNVVRDRVFSSRHDLALNIVLRRISQSRCCVWRLSPACRLPKCRKHFVSRQLQCCMRFIAKQKNTVASGQSTFLQIGGSPLCFFARSMFANAVNQPKSRSAFTFNPLSTCTNLNNSNYLCRLCIYIDQYINELIYSYIRRIRTILNYLTKWN